MGGQIRTPEGGVKTGKEMGGRGVRGVQELGGEKQRGPKERFSWRGPRVLMRGGVKGQKDPGKVGIPIRRGQTGPEDSFNPAVDPFDHAIGLGV